MNENTQKVNTVNKPIMILREEFLMNLSNLINNSSLPLFIIEPMLRDMLSEINIELKKQYEYEKAQYERSLMNSKNTNGEKDD